MSDFIRGTVPRPAAGASDILLYTVPPAATGALAAVRLRYVIANAGNDRVTRIELWDQSGLKFAQIGLDFFQLASLPPFDWRMSWLRDYPQQEFATDATAVPEVGYDTNTLGTGADLYPESTSWHFVIDNVNAADQVSAIEVIAEVDLPDLPAPAPTVPPILLLPSLG